MTKFHPTELNRDLLCSLHLAALLHLGVTREELRVMLMARLSLPDDCRLSALFPFEGETGKDLMVEFECEPRGMTDPELQSGLRNAT